MLQYTALDATMAAHTNIAHIYLCFSSSVEKPHVTQTFALCFGRSTRPKNKAVSERGTIACKGGGGEGGHSAGTFTRRLCDIFCIFYFFFESIEKRLQQEKKCRTTFSSRAGGVPLAARRRRRVIQVDLNVSTWRFCSGGAGGTASVPGKFTLIWMG